MLPFWILFRVFRKCNDDCLSSNNVKIEIGGHTDNVGTKAYNKFLSNKRAILAKAYLVENGISVARIETKGYGEEFPIATNSTKEGRRLNRRAELVSLPKSKDFIASRTYGQQTHEKVCCDLTQLVG